MRKGSKLDFNAPEEATQRESNWANFYKKFTQSPQRPLNNDHSKSYEDAMTRSEFESFEFPGKNAFK